MEETSKAAAPLNAHYHSLGRLCVAWATIDRQLNDVLATMLGCSEAAVACVTSTNDTVASRCEILRKLVFEDPLSAEWADMFVALMTLISQDLASKRNRYVHDYWIVSEGTITRLDRRAKTAKPQSHKPVEIVYDVENVTPPDEVNQLWLRIEDAAFMLHCALRDAQDWKEHRLHATPPLLARARDHFALQDSLQQSEKDASPPQ